VTRNEQAVAQNAAMHLLLSHIPNSLTTFSSFSPASPSSLTEHTCYNGNGVDYRGAASRTQNGLECGPWNRQVFYSTADNPELIGGHNFCRNPGGMESQPWCFDHESKRQLCDVPKCSKFLLLLSHSLHHVLRQGEEHIWRRCRPKQAIRKVISK
jgi:hypothetical protein